MFKRISALRNFAIVRNKSESKIRQVEPKLISKADRVKKLYAESKTLFGAKVKEIKGKKAVTQVQPPVDDEPQNDNDLSSEIFWTCHHVPEVQDFSVVKSAKKKKKTKDENVPVKAEKKKKASVTIEVKEQPKKSVVAKKKTKAVEFAPELPDSLTKLQNALPDVSAEIKSTLNAVLNIKHPETDIKLDELEIPFGSQQLNQITNFPLTMNKSKIISSFANIEKRPFYLPSVSKILQATMPESQRNALIQWKQLKISELGLQGFETMQKSHLTRGKEFHQCLHNHFTGVPKPEITPEVLEIWKSIEPLLVEFKAPGVLIEEKIEHPFLLYQGVVDCVSYHKSTLCVIEWKKSDRHKKSLSYTYDAPVQLCSYLGALNASREEFHDNPIKDGVVVVAYNDGQKADLFELNEAEMKKYWKLWLNRVQEYWVRYKDDTLPAAI